jgi:hypothetical protein
MSFSSYEQQKAAMANIHGEGSKHKRSWKIKASGSKRTRKGKPEVKIVSRDEFDRHLVSTGNSISPFAKGLYVYKENTTYVNRDNVRGPEDLQRTILHEEAHSLFGPDERKAEAYALDKILTEYKPQDPKEHERLMNAEMRLFHPTNSILKDPQTIPLEEKERILRKDAEMILTPSGSLLMGENPNNVMAAPKDALNYKFRVENHVIGAGIRVAIAKELPDKVDLSLENVTDERGEHVVVHVKGSESDVEEYRKKIVDLKNSNKLGKAADYDISKIQEDTIQDLDTGRTFNKLECEQMSTFVDSSLELRDLTKDMSGKIDTLTAETKSGFAGLHQDMKLLPGEIAKAIKGS